MSDTMIDAPSNANDHRNVDPSALEILGVVAEALGLAEQVQRLLPLDRMRVERRHKRVERLLDSFRERLEDARAALRVVSSTVADSVADAPRDSIGFPVPVTELPVLKRGLDQLHDAIKKMTTVAFDLEAATTGLPDEAQRYYTISRGGRGTLEVLRRVMNGETASIPELLTEIEAHLGRCANIIREQSLLEHR